ncbi:MAG: multidrug effflux MFS transporter [Hyphomonas sp.]
MADIDASKQAGAPLPQKSAKSFPGTTELVVMVAGLMALNAFAIDIMLPALHQIALDVGLSAEGEASNNRQQMIVFAYVLGFGAPQLVWGPISDRFGRRAPLFIALTGYILMAITCAFMRDFTSLLVVRFVQGVFASGARLVGVSVVRDMFAGRDMARFMSLVMTIFMIIPIIAPSIGQIILYVTDWKWIFGVLAIFGAIMLTWTYLRLPETLPPPKRQSLSLKRAGSSYAAVIRSRVTFGYMIASGIVFGALFSFIGSAEQVFREVFHQENTFAYWFAGIACALAFANFTNARIVQTVGMRRISHIALIVFTAVAALLAGTTWLFGENLYRFFILFAICFGCFGMMGANFSALAMEPLGKIAGTASAAYGFMTTTVSSIFGMTIGHFYDGSTIPLMLGFVALGVSSLIVVLVTEKGKLFSRV